MLTETTTTALDLRPEGPVRRMITTTVLRDGAVLATTAHVDVRYPGDALDGLPEDEAAAIGAWWTPDRLAAWDAERVRIAAAA